VGGGWGGGNEWVLMGEVDMGVWERKERRGGAEGRGGEGRGFWRDENGRMRKKDAGGRSERTGLEVGCGRTGDGVADLV